MKNFTLASVESFTGGLFAATIVEKPGSSKYFKGSIVTYHNDIKDKLGVNVTNGVINSNTALEMAKRGKEFFNVDYCIAFTGNAGPTAMEDKPVGLFYIAINNQVYEFFYPNLSRNEIRKKAVEIAIKKLNLCKIFV